MINRAQGSAVDRFWRYVDKTPGHGPSGDCWIWTGGKTPEGYGRFRGERSVMVSANRFSFEMAFGPLPDELLACHKCDFPPCIRPDHLFPGTGHDNAMDASSKGRLRPNIGERQWKAKLTAELVMDIRSRYHAGGISQRTLAKEFGITQSWLSRIVRHEMWRHVPCTCTG